MSGTRSNALGCMAALKVVAVLKGRNVVRSQGRPRGRVGCSVQCWQLPARYQQRLRVLLFPCSV